MSIVRQTSFGAGELSPSLWGATHLDAYGSGLRTLRNFIVSKYRTALNRPGTIYCGEVKDSSKLTRLLPFTFSRDQSNVLEMGDLYARIWDSAGNQLKAQALIALGDQNTTRAKSVDKGATWTQPTAPPGNAVTTYYGACEAGNGRIVAVGYTVAVGSICAVSDDGGVTWVQKVIPGAVHKAVAYNGRVLLAVTSGSIYGSYDNGDTWALIGAPAGLYTSSDAGACLAWGNGRWILVGTDVTGTKARYATSYDGVTWTAATAVGDLDTARPDGHALHAVCFLAGHFFGVGQVKVTPGTYKYLWARIGVLSSNWKWGEVGAATANVHSLRGVATDGNRAVAVGYEAAVGPATYAYDPVLDTVTDLLPAGAAALHAVAYSRGYWVAVGVSVCKRYDGSAWTADPVIAAGTYHTVATCNGTETLEVVSPYDSGMVRQVAHAQSGDVVTMFHRYFAPREFKRYGLHDWRLDAWYKMPPTLKVSGLAFVGVPDQVGDATHVPKEWETVVTWEDEETGVESLPSDPLTAGGTGKYVVMPDRPQSSSWTVIVKARRYHVYRGQKGGGEWGWIGSVKQPVVAAGASPTTVTFRDDGQVPLYDETPPQWTNPFQSDLAYPACGCYLDDRLVVGGSTVQPATIRGSAVANYHNFDEQLLPGDDDAFEHTLACRRFEEIRWLVALERLIVGTQESEWVVGGSASGDAPITANQVFARAKSARGSSDVQPVVVGDGVVYVQNGGQVVRDFRTVRDVVNTPDPTSWGGAELSIFSQHLLEGFSIVDMAYAKEPHSVIWIVRSDGALLSLTFIREHGVWGWARHDSGGDVFEAVTVVPDGSRDVPFFVVKRTINGATKRYVERLATRSPATSAVGVFLDCAKTYTGAPTNVVGGLGHLEGRTVGVLADGTYRGTAVVVAGSVQFGGAAAATVVVGLPIVADVESLDYPQGQTKQKTVSEVALESRVSPAVADPDAGVYIGQDAATLGGLRKFTDFQDGKIIVPIEGSVNPGGRCFLRHTQPFPLEVTGVTREVG